MQKAEYWIGQFNQCLRQRDQRRLQILIALFNRMNLGEPLPPEYSKWAMNPGEDVKSFRRVLHHFAKATEVFEDQQSAAEVAG